MNEIKFWRLQKQCGLSNQKAADYLGMNISTIKRYRNGKLTPPKLVIMAMENLIKQESNNNGE